MPARVRDPKVMQEWGRRLALYRARSAWLRIPFYGAPLIFFGGLVVLTSLPPGVMPYIAGLAALMLLFGGVCLSIYSPSSIRCPHCGERPIGMLSPRNGGEIESCGSCGYVLSGDADDPQEDDDPQESMSSWKRWFRFLWLQVLIIIDTALTFASFFAVINFSVAETVLNGCVLNGYTQEFGPPVVPATWEAVVYDHGFYYRWYLIVRHPWAFAATLLLLVASVVLGLLLERASRRLVRIHREQNPIAYKVGDVVVLVAFWAFLYVVLFWVPVHLGLRVRSG